MQRISAPEIERVLSETVRRWFPKGPDVFEMVHAVHVGARGLRVSLEAGVATKTAARLRADEAILDRSRDKITVFLTVFFQHAGGNA